MQQNKTKKRVVSFGEIMLRLTPPEHERLVQANEFEATYGGAEANVAVSLAILGMDARFVTRLPQNPLGEAALSLLRKYGVDTSCILRGGERLGLYYMERGTDRRPARVVYDRAHSAIATALAEAFDWRRILDGADYFHLTGITPALGDQLITACLDACRTAKEMGVTVSFDPNYRATLWEVDAAAQVMGRLMPCVDVLVTNETQASALFGVDVPLNEKNGEDVTDEGYRILAGALTEKYDLKAVALTERRTYSAEVNSFCAKLYDGQQLYPSPIYRMNMIDRVGGGDAFAAGLLYAMCEGYAPSDAVEFAAAASCLKHSIKGDVNLSTKDEIEMLVKNGGGQVKR